METKMTKIAVLVSGGGTNLQALIDAEKRGELGNGKITLVLASVAEKAVFCVDCGGMHDTACVCA